MEPVKGGNLVNLPEDAKAVLAAVERVQEIFRSKQLIPCPSCRYCTDGCPQHLPIRMLLEDVAKEFEKA